MSHTHNKDGFGQIALEWKMYICVYSTDGAPCILEKKCMYEGLFIAVQQHFKNMPGSTTGLLAQVHAA